MPSRTQKRARTFAPVIALTVALGAALPTASVAQAAAPTDSTSGNAAAGRAEGSGKLGYIGEYGTANNTSVPAAGEFNHPYGIAVDPRDGMSLVVSDSGNVNWGSEGRLSQQSGHSVQWVARAASYDPLPGNYRAGGAYDLSIPASEGFGGNFAFEHIAIQRTATNENYGPRGIAVAPSGEVFFTSSQFGTAGAACRAIAFAASALTEAR